MVRTRTTIVSRALTVFATFALLLVTASPAGASPHETADIVGQGPDGPVVAPDGAHILRGTTGLNASVSMPTPEPGSYVYPEGDTASGRAGHPEAFSLWVFVFFNPEACDGPCNGPDLVGNEDVVAGAFNAGGHLVAGSNLTMSGRVTEQHPTFGGPNAETIGEALAAGHDLADAEVHLAVAPHGALAPELLPAQITTPAGNSAHWWIAIFG